MAQAYTSILKFNIDGRPYVRDIHDLFSALLTQVKFSSHKHLFTTYENTMTSEDILEVLSHLQFTQAIRVPTPDLYNNNNSNNNNSLHFKTTITTTTFNMERGVAKALCQQFIWAKLMYSATDPFNRSYRDRSLWKVTPKGLIILNEFCERIEIDHPLLLLLTMENENIPPIGQFKILNLERNEDDQLIISRPNMTFLFRTMINATSNDGNGMLYKQSNTNNTIVHKVKKYKKRLHQQRKSSLSSSSSTASSIYSGIHHYKPNDDSKRSSMVSSIHSATIPLSILSISSSPSSNNDSTTYKSSPSSDTSNNNTNGSGSGGNYFSNMLEKFNIYDLKSNTSFTPSIYKHQYHNNDLDDDFNDDIENEDSEDDDDNNHFGDYEDDDSEGEYAIIRRMRVIFTSQYCCDWLGASCSLISRDEAEMLATQFLKHGWIRFYKDEENELDFIESSKHTTLSVTPKGRQLVIDGIHTANKSQCHTPMTTTPTTPTTPVYNFNSASPSSLTSFSRPSSTNLDDISTSSYPTSPSTYSYYSPLEQKQSQQQQPSEKYQHSSKLMMILKDAQLRSLFKDFLKANFCVENLDFWIDYHHLKNKCKNKNPTLSKQHQKDLLDDAIAIWAKYLSPKAIHELNIDHDLQQDLKRYVKSIVKFESSLSYKTEVFSSKLVYISTQTESQSLFTLLKRFDLVEVQICRLMASDSVPKFSTWLHQSFKNNNNNNNNKEKNNKDNNNKFLKLNLQSLKI